MADPLTVLRTGLKRVAEATKDPEVLGAIPQGDEIRGIPYAERGWNRLCAFLCEWIEEHR